MNNIVDYSNWTTRELVEQRSWLIRDRNKEEMYSDRAELNKTIVLIQKELDKRAPMGFDTDMRSSIDQVKKAAKKAEEQGELYGIPKGAIG